MYSIDMQQEEVPVPFELYKELAEMNEFERIERLTEVLVNIPSVNGTKGEVVIADYLKELMTQLPYFQRNPHLLWETPLDGDALGRKNIFAFLFKERHGNTVVYHSHLDTVGVEDFGSLRDDAFHPSKLLTYFSKQTEHHEIQNEAVSGEWMFGRGATDMKAGVAVHVFNLWYFTEHQDEIDGNVLLMLNPVEENEHTGIIEAVPELQKLRDQYQLQYNVAVNNDFITDLYETDPNLYLYTGAVGKILPCFSIYGKSAHVGETLSGIDPTLISSSINRRLNNNMALAERLEGEHMLPPSCLQQRDTKEFYNVQTAIGSRLYFNYFLYQKTPKEVLNELTVETEKACLEVKSYLHAQYEEFIKVGGYPEDQEREENIDVYSYSEYLEKLSAQGMDVERIINAIVNGNADMEKRELTFKIVEALQHEDADQKARVVIFFAPPFCPHNYLRQDVEEENTLIHNIEEASKQFSEELAAQTGKSFVVKKFFPFLSDSSYLSLHDTDSEMNSLIENFPSYQKIYPLPTASIRELNIPSINLGVFGKDAHQRTERVYKPYSFSLLPQMIREVTKNILTRRSNE